MKINLGKGGIKKIISIVLISFFLISAGIVLFYLKNVNKPTPLPAFLSNEVAQSLERSPTKKILTREIYTYFSGKIEMKNGKYVGSIDGGNGYAPKEDDKKKQESLLQDIQKDPGALNSLFVAEARDINNQILISLPLAVLKSEKGSDISFQSYKDTGYFSAGILFPPNTNSLDLRVRSGNILDKIYVEEWEPEVKILQYPKKAGSTDKLPIEIELLPVGKAFEYALYLKNTKNDSEIFFVGGSTTPKNGTKQEIINLNGFPFTETADWKIMATGFSFFGNKSTETEPINIALSSENIKVKIYDKNIKTRKAGEFDYIIWSQVFYEIDASRALEELCKKGRCFELVWSGDNVEFNEKYWDPNPVATFTTQMNSMQCNFRGSGKQSIRLQVKENGKIIGEDTYTFNVSGGGNEKSLCQNFE